MPKETKNEQGRPTKYKEEYEEQARKLCMLGHTDAELAKYFEVAESTLYKWKLEHPTFSESIKRAKALVDAEVADKLYHRAIGYSHPEVKVFCSEGVVTEHEVVKHYAPDVAAAAIWLKNRQPKLWNDKKASAQAVSFKLDTSLPIEQQAKQILHAISTSVIPPDIGAMLITGMSNVLKIEEVTAIKDELHQIKSKLGLDDV